MGKKFFYKLQTTITGGAIIIGVASIISRLLGLLRDRLLAANFGAGDVLDTYYAAFKIPDLIFNILVLGALSAAFIPIFLSYWSKDKEEKDRDESWRIANSVLNLILITLFIIGGIFFILVPKLMFLIAPGFSPEKQLITAKLTRIMLASILFFGFSNVVSGILNSFRRFIAYSLAPIAYNLGIIFGIVVLVPQPKLGVYGLALGVVLGAFLHLMIQIPSVIKVGFRWRVVLDYTHQGVKKIIKLMIPRTLGLAVTQINQLVIIIIASTLAAGSVAIFNLATNLQHFPINVFGVSLAISSFPVFSKAFSEKDTNQFIVNFSETVRRILYLIIPVSVIILLLRAQIVRLILGTGSFDWTDTVLTAQTLGFFSLSLFAQSLIPVLARSFYAFQNTKTPVIIGSFSVILNIILAVILGKIMGVEGLALAFSIASLINMILLLIVLRSKIGELEDKKIIVSTLKIILASLLMGVFIQGLKYFIAPLVDMRTFVGVFLQAAGSIMGGIIIYLIITVLLKCKEISIIRNLILRAKRQVFNSPNSHVKD